MFRVTNQLRFIEPQLASPVDQPPEGKHWIHEIKHDGYRCQVLLERGQARVFTRNGFDEGFPLGQEIMQNAAEGTIKETTYWWPRPGSDEPLEKHTFFARVGDQDCGVGYYKG
jgi:hypothetical protein